MCERSLRSCGISTLSLNEVPQLTLLQCRASWLARGELTMVLKCLSKTKPALFFATRLWSTIFFYSSSGFFVVFRDLKEKICNAKVNRYSARGKNPLVSVAAFCITPPSVQNSSLKHFHFTFSSCHDHKSLWLTEKISTIFGLFPPELELEAVVPTNLTNRVFGLFSN